MNDTKENIIKLKYKFMKIYDRGWIKCDNPKTNPGNFFEELLDIKSGNFEIPDFENIEIKTRKTFSKAYLKLFNATPDGNNLFEIKRIQEKYGYPHYQMKNARVFNCSIYSNESHRVGNYYFKLKIDRDKEKLFLNIFLKNGELIDENTNWSFDLLKEKLYRKLKVLAVVDVFEKKGQGHSYYKYNNINFYQLKDFDTFIDLIDLGIIRVTFCINVFKSGKRIGQTHDHGTSFQITEKNLIKLYDKLNF